MRIIDESFRPGKLHFVTLRVNSVSLQRRILFTYFVCAFRDNCVNESNLNHRMWSIYLGYQNNLIWYLLRSLNKMCFFFTLFYRYVIITDSDINLGKEISISFSKILYLSYRTWFFQKILIAERCFDHLLLSDRFLAIPSSSKSFCSFEHDVIIFQR